MNNNSFKCFILFLVKGIIHNQAKMAGPILGMITEGSFQCVRIIP